MAAAPSICVGGTSSLSRFCVSVEQTLQSRSPFTRALMGLNKSALRFDSERLRDDSSHSRLCVAACHCKALTHTHTHIKGNWRLFHFFTTLLPGLLREDTSAAFRNREPARHGVFFCTGALQRGPPMSVPLRLRSNLDLR